MLRILTPGHGIFVFAHFDDNRATVEAYVFYLILVKLEMTAQSPAIVECDRAAST